MARPRRLARPRCQRRRLRSLRRPLPLRPSRSIGDDTERQISVETNDVIAVFTNRGARLKSWRLKKYLDQSRHPQELVEGALANHPLPFTLGSGDERLDLTLNQSLYAVNDVPASPITAPVDIRFEYRDNAGVRAVKEFHLTPTSYVVDIPRRHCLGRSCDHACHRLGTGGRRHRRGQPVYAGGRRDALRKRRQSPSGSRRRTSRNSRPTTAISCTRASTTTTS